MKGGRIIKLQKIENVSKQILKFTGWSIYLDSWIKSQRNQTIAIQIVVANARPGGALPPSFL